MTPRPPVDRQRILAAAEAVISERGFARATTKAIAHAAGCSEGSIYNHFENKESLFVQCTLARNNSIVDLVRTLPDRVGANTVYANLRELLDAMLHMHREMVPLFVTLWSEPDLVRQQHEVARQHLPDALRAGPHAIIADYLRAEQAIGRVGANVDCVAAAAVLHAIPFDRALTEHAGTPDVTGLIGDDYIERVLRTVLNGLDVRDRPRRKATS